GYRWFDRTGAAPLYPFGHGLSYTRFAYSGLTVSSADDKGLDVHFTLANTGERDGDEVAQTYLGAPKDPPAGVSFPVRTLVAFARVRLKAGETRSVTLHVAPRQLQYWSATEHGWRTAQGPRALSIGASSRDLRLRGWAGS
ncbi:MAG TPA: fibronectin type III-like domain-contianing protein, partial [Caulobacteraceae bacterium]|nr:fibronectin type III-like domain-contianing protein [Caulobacteraceae bacterium]